MGASYEHASMDHDRVRRLAERVDDAAESAGEANSALVVTAIVALPFVPTPLGTTPGAEGCWSAYQELASDGGTAISRLRAVLSTDAERLRQAVERFERMEDSAADHLSVTAGNRLDVFNTHVQAGSDPHEEEARADQINTAVDTLEDQSGATVFTGDLNVDYQQDDAESAEAVERLEDAGFEHASDGVGPTAGDRQIDYIFTTSDLRPGEPGRVEANDPEDGFHSDHDGVVVDVEIPPSW